MHIHHLALRTLDVTRLLAFYRDLLGLADAEGPDDALLGEGARQSLDRRWLAAGPTTVMIEPRGDLEPAIDGRSMELVAFAIDARTKADFEARLARAGVAVEHRTGFTLYFRDPDGRRVGVSHYPRTVEDPTEPRPRASRDPT